MRPPDPLAALPPADLRHAPAGIQGSLPGTTPWLLQSGVARYAPGSKAGQGSRPRGWRASMAEIVLDRVSKVYSGGVKGVNDLTLEISDGEFMVLVGPSGCGKSTALRSIAGLEEITSGTITIGGRVVNNLPPKDRDIAMVFQNYALYPHMTVE